MVEPAASARVKPQGRVPAWLRKLGPSRTFVRTDLQTLRLAIAERNRRHTALHPSQVAATLPPSTRWGDIETSKLGRITVGCDHLQRSQCQGLSTSNLMVLSSLLSLF